MSKSELTQACYGLNLEIVRGLIDGGARVDGADNQRWHGEAEGCLDGAPFYTPLGEACRSGDGAEQDALAIVDLLLEAGAPVDGLNYRTETPLHFAALAGRARLIRRLVEAGADVNAVGCMGNAVLALMTYSEPDTPGGPKVEALHALLDAGIDPRAPDAFGRDLVDHVGEGPIAALASRSRNDKVRGRAMFELMTVIGERTSGWAELDTWLERAHSAWLAGDAKARKAYEKMQALLAEADGAAFEKKVRRAIGRKAAGRQEALALLVDRVLTQPAAVAHPAWSDLIRSLLALTGDYGDLTEEIYGQRLSVDEMQDDEGGVLDMYADEGLSTVELCLVACAAPGARDRDDFAALVGAICETKYARIGHMSFGDDEAAALIGQLDSAGHPQAAALRSVARRCFPYADWS